VTKWISTGISTGSLSKGRCQRGAVKGSLSKGRCQRDAVKGDKVDQHRVCTLYPL